MVFEPIAAARLLQLTARTAALATLDFATGAPFASLVTVATAPDGAPILLLSQLALHTRNIAADARASLLVDDRSAGRPGDDPLAGSRLTLSGRIVRIEADAEKAVARRRFLARHRDAEGYAGFADFAFYRLDVAAGHLVAGFGRIETIPGDALIRPAAAAEALVAAEVETLASLNGDPAGYMAAIAAALHLPGGDWRAIAIDPYGIDLQRQDAAGIHAARWEMGAGEVSAEPPARTPADVLTKLRALL